MPTLAEMIAARAAELGQSDVKISRLLDVDPSTVNRWRNGALPRKDLIPAIAGWLGVSEAVVAEAMYSPAGPSLDAVLAEMRTTQDLVHQLVEQCTRLDQRVARLEAGGPSRQRAVR